MAQTMHSGVTHERCADFRHGKKTRNGAIEFITPPRPTGRRSNNAIAQSTAHGEILQAQNRKQTEDRVTRVDSAEPLKFVFPLMSQYSHIMPHVHLELEETICKNYNLSNFCAR